MIFSFAGFWEMLGLCIKGIPISLELAAIVFVVSLVLGFVIAIIRHRGGHPILEKILLVYVSFERGVPVIVQIMLLFSTLPRLLDSIVTRLGFSFRPSGLPNLFFAAIILALIQTAFLSETLRGGLKSVNKGQLEGAIVSGIPAFHAYRRIILPQVLSNILPVLCTNVNALIKMTSLAFSMSIMDIMSYAKVRAAQNYKYIEAYLAIAVVYILICMTVELIFKLFETYRSSRQERRLVKVKKQGGPRNAEG